MKKVFGEENVVDALFPPVGTPDYGPYLAKLDPTKADGLLAAMWGADSPRIARQYAEYGLKGRRRTVPTIVFCPRNAGEAAGMAGAIVREQQALYASGLLGSYLWSPTPGLGVVTREVSVRSSQTL